MDFILLFFIIDFNYLLKNLNINISMSGALTGASASALVLKNNIEFTGVFQAELDK